MDAKQSDTAERIAVDQLTKAAFSGVLAALQERDFDVKEWPGPILVGIIAWPEIGKLPERSTLPGQ